MEKKGSEKKSKTEHKTEYKRINVELLNGTIISGEINIKAGKKDVTERLSDMLTKNNDRPYLIIKDAIITRIGMSSQSQSKGLTKILFVNKQNIAFAEPCD